jgi:hypothetical protein
MSKTETPINDALFQRHCAEAGDADRECLPALALAQVTELKALSNRLERDRAELIGALEILDHIGNVVLPLHQHRNAPDQIVVMGWDKVSLRLGHLRKARALLAKHAQKVPA